MADTNPDLLFQQPADVAPDLMFGSAYETPAVRNVSVLVRLGGVTARAYASQPVRAYAALVVGGVTLSACVYYDNRVTPYLDTRYKSSQHVAIPRTSDNGGNWGVSKNSERQSDPTWQAAKFGSLEQTDQTKASLPMLPKVDVKHTLGDGRTATTSTRSDVAKFIDTGRSTAYSKADPQRAITSSGMQAGIFKIQARGQDWQGAVSRQLVRSSTIGKGITNQGYNSLVAHWALAGLGQAGMGSPPVPQPKPDIPVAEVVSTQILFECHPISGAPALVFGGKSTRGSDRAGTTIIPVRRVYFVINNASLRRLDGQIELPVLNMTLSLDTDSWTWGLNAVLSGEALPALLPAQDYQPVTLEAEVNGQQWQFLLERISRSRTFGKSEIRIQCRGNTAVLDAPYAPVQSFNNTAARTARQLMQDVLTRNGAGLGWDVEWGLQDWLVPAGVFSHQGSYVSALQQIAKSAGGYLQPHPTRKLIRALPRYPAPPWQWDSIVPDYHVLADITAQETLQWLEKPAYNRVFVSGQEAGILGQVSRSGTAGDVIAPMVVDALITDATVARQRGTAILSDTGRQMEVSLRLPVLKETGVIVPGAFVQYQDAQIARRGLVRSVQIEASLPEVWQTIGVQTYA